MNANAQPKRDDCVKSYEWLAACSFENAATTSAIPAMSRTRLNLRTLSASDRSPYLYIGWAGRQDEDYVGTFCGRDRDGSEPSPWSGRPNRPTRPWSLRHAKRAENPLQRPTIAAPQERRRKRWTR